MFGWKLFKEEIKEAPELDYRFTPQHDITAFELALLLKLKNNKISKSGYDSLLPGVRRHFRSLEQ